MIAGGLFLFRKGFNGAAAQRWAWPAPSLPGHNTLVNNSPIMSGMSHAPTPLELQQNQEPPRTHPHGASRSLVTSLLTHKQKGR